MKWFVLNTGRLSDDEVLKLSTKLAKPLEWWHQISDCWLINDPTDAHTCATLRDLMAEVNEKVECLVIEVEAKGWAARLYPAKHESNREWMAKNWNG